MKETLWTKNFKYMFVGTILSALGGIGLNAALGVVIFDNTQSTFLTSLFVSIVSIPHLILPLFVGSLVDRKDPLRLLLKNETILIGFYLMFLLAYIFLGFNYSVFLLLSFFISSFGVVSELSNQSISAQLMSKDNMSRGYAILSTIYPLCNVLVVPIALFIYKSFGLQYLFVIYILLSTFDLLLESQIDFKFKYNNLKLSNKEEVIKDFKEGFEYLNTVRPIKTVFIFFTIVMLSNGFSNLIYPYFNQSSTLTLENYALLMSVNSLGYMFGGFFHYFVEIPKKYRYTAAIIIYMIFIILDSTLLFMPFVMMLISKFILGLAGMNSANIRNTAVQSSVKDVYRGKVNGIFSMLMGLASVVGNLLFGFLGEIISIPNAILIAQFMYLGAILVFVIPKRNGVKELYNLELASK